MDSLLKKWSPTSLWSHLTSVVQGWWNAFFAKPEKERQQWMIALGISGCIGIGTLMYFQHRRQRMIKELNEKMDRMYFSHSYSEARAKLFDALKQSNFKEGKDYYLSSHRIPVGGIHRNSGVDCFIDFVFFPCQNSMDDSKDDDSNQQRRKKDKLFIHMSGVHGVEGYAGSAIQTAILKSKEFARLLSDNKNKKTNNHTHYLFIHAVNPTGMAFNRRFTVNDNIDLNRNFFNESKFDPDSNGGVDITAEDYKVVSSDGDETNVYFPNQEYSQFQYMTSPQNRITNFWRDDCYVWLQMLYHSIKFGKPRMSKMVVNGQYRFERGLFYGGSQLAPELFVLKQYFKEELPLMLPKECFDGNPPSTLDRNTFDKVIFVDVHTGLGPTGKDTLLTVHRDHFDLFRNQLFKDDEEYSTENRIQCMTAMHLDEDQSGGTFETKFDAFQLYAHSFGSVKHGLLLSVFGLELSRTKEEDRVEDAARCVAVTQEFGTVHGLKVFLGMRNENMCHWYCSDRMRDPKVAAEHYHRGMKLRKVFYLYDDPYWKQSVIFNGLRLFSRLNSGSI